MKYNIKKEECMGIYKIVNTTTNKVYIGKTKNFYKRYHQYKYAFSRQDIKRINDYLLNSFNKYGFNGFEFECIESFDKLDDDIISTRELYWMDHYNSTNHNFGYNLRRDSSSKMVTHPSTSKKYPND